MKKPGRNIRDLAKHNTAPFILLDSKLQNETSRLSPTVASLGPLDPQVYPAEV
jgi:hypothetical protein